MTDPIPPDFLALSDLRGKITLPDPVTGQPVVHVYQRTSSHLANAATEQHPRLQLRREPGGRKGNTPKQQQHGRRFAPPRNPGRPSARPSSANTTTRPSATAGA